MQDKKPLILVTNDDGVYSKGIRTLAEIASAYGEVIVSAPIEGQSGMSHAITIKHPLRIRKISSGKNITYFGCSGTPVDSVKLAMNKILKRRPDLVLSGINHGSNAAASIVYSGTMAAAMEGGINQIPAIGFSILDWDENADFSHITGYIQTIIKNVISTGLPAGVCLNVNMPKLNGKNIKGIKVCRQNSGYWQEEFEMRKDPFNKEYYWLTGEFKNLEPDATDTDEWALKNNYISIVPVLTDLTCYKTLHLLKDWEKQ